MSFGISGSDPFKSYSNDKDAGGGMGVFAKKRRKNQNKKEDNKKEESLLEIGDDIDDDNLEIDFDDSEDFL